MGMVEVLQPRKSAWVCDSFNQSATLKDLHAAGYRLEPSMLVAQPFQPWSREIIERGECTTGAKFNALLLHRYEHGRHSMGFHSDVDEGLGEAAVIGGFSLGARRTFAIKSIKPWF